MLSRVIDSAFFVLVLCTSFVRCGRSSRASLLLEVLSGDLCFAEVVDAVLEGFDF